MEALGVSEVVVMTMMVDDDNIILHRLRKR